jgi:hypothetical protein
MGEHNAPSFDSFLLAAFAVLQTACGNSPVSSGASSGSSFSSSVETRHPMLPLIVVRSAGIFGVLPPHPATYLQVPSPCRNAASLEEYFPFQKNVYKKFAGIGNEYAEFETFWDYIDGHVMQVRTINPGTATVSCIVWKTGPCTDLFCRERYFRLNETSARTGEDFLIKEPLKPEIPGRLRRLDTKHH